MHHGPWHLRLAEKLLLCYFCCRGAITQEISPCSQTLTADIQDLNPPLNVETGKCSMAIMHVYPLDDLTKAPEDVQGLKGLTGAGWESAKVV